MSATLTIIHTIPYKAKTPAVARRVRFRVFTAIAYLNENKARIVLPTKLKIARSARQRPSHHNPLRQPAFSGLPTG
jgi:hypothetical protein